MVSVLGKNSHSFMQENAFALFFHDLKLAVWFFGGSHFPRGVFFLIMLSDLFVEKLLHSTEDDLHGMNDNDEINYSSFVRGQNS